VVSTAPRAFRPEDPGAPHVTTDPEELDPELDAELVADDELEDELEDDLADGFVVEGDEDDDADDVDDAVEDATDVDEGSTVAVIIAAEDPDDFEEELAPVVRVPEDEDDAPGRQAGEFICTRCYLVKKDSQHAVRSRKVCRDCA
jgi:hypothetical protein